MAKSVMGRLPSIRLRYKGEERTVREWSERTGVSTAAIYQRIAAGWSVARALETPVRSTSYAELAQAAKKRGLAYQTVYRRIRRGWSPEDAASTPVRCQLRPQLIGLRKLIKLYEALLRHIQRLPGPDNPVPARWYQLLDHQVHAIFTAYQESKSQPESQSNGD